MSFIALSADLQYLAILFLCSLLNRSYCLRRGHFDCFLFETHFENALCRWLFFVIVIVVVEQHDTCKLAICQSVVISPSLSFILYVFDSIVCMRLLKMDFILYLFLSLCTSFHSLKLFLLVGSLTRSNFNWCVTQNFPHIKYCAA